MAEAAETEPTTLEKRLHALQKYAYRELKHCNQVVISPGAAGGGEATDPQCRD